MGKTAKTDADVAEMTLGHLAREGTDDIFRPPVLNRGIEFDEFSSSIFKAKLRKCIVAFLRNPSIDGFSPLLRFSVPKTRSTYRHASLIEIEDLARYTAIVFKIASHIENHRVPVSSGVVFSSRFEEADVCINRTMNYDGFRAKSGELSKDPRFKVKVLTDISNFYDRLNLHRLQSALLEIDCDKECVDAINQLLLHWANRNSYGLPVGGDASRILAEAMLINVDSSLIRANITFVRYVDDYRIFTSSFPQAHRALALLTDALDREGLFVNSEKTKILHCGTETDDAPLNPDDFQAIDEAERIPVIRRIQSGYRTRISTVYREPGKEAVNRLRSIDISSMVDEITADDAKEERLRLYVKSFIYGTNHDVSLLMILLQRHIHMLSFCVSALIKEAMRIDPEIRSELSTRFQEFYEELGEIWFYKLCVARLLSSGHYFRAEVFGGWFEKLPIHADPIFVRELVTFFGSRLSRREVLKLVGYSRSAHPAVRRAIIRATLANESCQRDEKRAWAQVWKSANDDPFTTSACCNFLYPARALPA